MPTFTSAEVHRMRLHVLPSNQFKTYSIALYIGLPLAEETVTPTALLPFVWRRGNSRYPETQAFRERLDELYGAGFGFDIVKRGNDQIVIIRMDIVNDAFIKDEQQSLLREALQFLSDTVLRPLIEDGTFKAQYVASEKETLRKRIESIINDKIRYAAERCIAEMCRNEAYRLPALGQVQDLPNIDAKSLYQHYQRVLDQSCVDLFVVGDTTAEEVQSIVSQLFPSFGSSLASYVPAAIDRSAVQEREVVERLDVKQGKLNMGLRAYVRYGDEAYPAALVYNGILGGYPHSKLFINVREKESLAYYASSRFDGHKGIIMVQTGIEISNKEKAEDIIRKQLNDMRQGNISEDELSKTKAMIAGSLREMNDSAFEQIAFHFNSVLSGNKRSKQQLIDAVMQVNKDRVVEIAQQVSLDTIYFLRDDEQGGEQQG